MNKKVFCVAFAFLFAFAVTSFVSAQDETVSADNQVADQVTEQSVTGESVVSGDVISGDCGTCGGGYYGGYYGGVSYGSYYGGASCCAPSYGCDPCYSSPCVAPVVYRRGLFGCLRPVFAPRYYVAPRSFGWGCGYGCDPCCW